MVINQFPFGLSPKQYTKQFGLCQGTPNPHRCEMVGGFYRCTLKIEDAVPVEVFTSFVLWSASEAAGMQQTPPASTAPIGRNLQPGCWVGGKRENTRCQELLYKNAFTASEQIGGGDPVWGLPLPVCSEKRYKQKMHRGISAPVRCMVRRKRLELPTF